MTRAVKLTPDQLDRAQARLAAEPGLSTRALAAELGVSQSTLSTALKLHRTRTTPGPISLVPLDQIDPSPLNPRRSFDALAVMELAQSIETSGLLQNLVLRRAGDRYLIVAGENRFRALNTLAASDRLPPSLSAGIPALIVEAGDADHLLTALVENLQRAELPPLEEAAAYLRLQMTDPALWTAGEIARRIGRTPRYVQQRLSLVTKLVPEATTALAAGALTIEAARLLAQEPAPTQQAILAEADHWDADQLRARLSRPQPVIARSAVTRQPRAARPKQSRVEPPAPITLVDPVPIFERLTPDQQRRLGIAATIAGLAMAWADLDRHIALDEALEVAMGIMQAEIDGDITALGDPDVWAHRGEPAQPIPDLQPLGDVQCETCGRPWIAFGGCACSQHGDTP